MLCLPFIEGQSFFCNTWVPNLKDYNLYVISFLKSQTQALQKVFVLFLLYICNRMVRWGIFIWLQSADHCKLPLTIPYGFLKETMVYLVLDNNLVIIFMVSG